jgi:hypothetical protein
MRQGRGDMPCTMPSHGHAANWESVRPRTRPALPLSPYEQPPRDLPTSDVEGCARVSDRVIDAQRVGTPFVVDSDAIATSERSDPPGQLHRRCHAPAKVVLSSAEASDAPT